MKKLTAPDATAMPGKKALKVKVTRGKVRTNPAPLNVRPRGWVA